MSIFRKVRKDCRCDCTHQKRHHYIGSGQCRYCGCTWFWPNLRRQAWKKKQIRKFVARLK